MSDIADKVRQHAQKHGIAGDAFATPAPAATAAAATDDEACTPTEIRCTDTGNALRFARMYGGLARYCHELLRWYVWDGRRLREDSTGEVLRKARRVVAEMWRELPAVADRRERDELYAWCKKSESAERLAAMVRLAQSEPGIYVAADELDADPWLLNVANGTLDLRNANLLPHDPARLLSKLAAVAYDPHAESPLWRAFIHRITGGNDALAGYLQRLAGVFATADTTVQEFWILHGSGANGKTTFVEALCGVLGDYAATAPESLLVARHNVEHPTEIAGLRGARAVFADETEAGDKLRLQLVKRLTGSERIRARYMRGDFFEFRRTFKLALSTNNRPVIHEQTVAAWRRIRLVPFTAVIPEAEQVPDFGARLVPEYPAILRWMVEGCLAWRRDGLHPPPCVLAATESYRAESDPLGDYCSERLAAAPGGRVSRSALWQDFESWQTTTGERIQTTRNALFDRVRKVPGAAESEWKLGGSKVRGFSGITFGGGSNSATDLSDCV